MAINKNHEFEELGGVKCSIVERNATKERVTFLKELLEHNGFEVVVVSSPPPKAAPAVKSAPTDQGEAQPQPQPSPPAENYTIGVTNLAFNPTNAIFGRLLKTKDGHIVTRTYWRQEETESHDEIPYYEQNL
jgi:hypothetical protein